MTTAAANGATAHPVASPSLRRRAVRVARFGVWVVLSPLRLFLSIRRSMTAASVTLLLIGIITMNIIWGYPWIGMFSACASLLFVGFAINRIMSPQLQFDFSLSNSSPAGQPFSVVSHVKNRRHLPAMDLRINFDQPPAVGRKENRSSPNGSWSPTPAQKLSLIRPGNRRDLSTFLAHDRRGIHRLPDVVVTSMFPFHLFRFSGHYPSEARIAITPRPLTGDEDAMSRGLVDSLGDWSHRLLSGDALDYTGSREYEVGMPVRRWDFTSWARLGRPIVREFQSPSIQMVTLIIDTATSDTSSTNGSEYEPEIERVLSLAAAAVTDLTRKLVRVRLYVSSESPSAVAEFDATHSHSNCESLLIRLAAAESVSPLEADQRVQQVLAQLGRSPGLILTSRQTHGWRQDLPPNVTILEVASTADQGETGDHRGSRPDAGSGAHDHRTRKATPSSV